MFEIGAQCAVIVDQASGEGREAGSEREREAMGIIYSAQTKLEKTSKKGASKDCKDACEGNMKEASLLLLK